MTCLDDVAAAFAKAAEHDVVSERLIGATLSPEPDRESDGSKVRAESLNTNVRLGLYYRSHCESQKFLCRY